MGKADNGYWSETGGYYLGEIDEDYFSEQVKDYLGEIDERDFNTNSPDRNRINRQAETDRTENRRRKFGSMTLEELRRMRAVCNTNGRPPSYLTDEKWQTEFELRKMFISPYPPAITRMSGHYTKFQYDNGRQVSGYSGETNYSRYCAYINDVLKVIESGQHDYCYYIYQIEDLLKFHHEDLRTLYKEYGQYWEVWLE